jgi:hypothetical protein
MFSLNFGDNFFFGIFSSEENNQHSYDKAEILDFYLPRNPSFIQKGLFYVGYYLGAFFGAMLIPLLFWILWVYNYRIDKKTQKEKEARIIEEIISHPTYGVEFVKKMNSLDNLYKINTLDKDKYKERRKNLIRNYYKPIEDEIKSKKRAIYHEELKEALKLGTLTEREYNARMGIRTRR